MMVSDIASDAPKPLAFPLAEVLLKSKILVYLLSDLQR